MISFCFPLGGVIGGLWGSTACWLEFDGKLLANTGSVTVATEGEGLGLATFFIFSLALLEPLIVAKCLLIDVSRNVGFYTRT